MRTCTRSPSRRGTSNWPSALRMAWWLVRTTTSTVVPCGSTMPRSVVRCGAMAMSRMFFSSGGRMGPPAAVDQRLQADGPRQRAAADDGLVERLALGQLLGLAPVLHVQHHALFEPVVAGQHAPHGLRPTFGLHFAQ